MHIEKKGIKSLNEIDFNYETNLLNNFRNFPDFYLLVKIDIKEKNVFHEGKTQKSKTISTIHKNKKRAQVKAQRSKNKLRRTNTHN